MQNMSTELIEGKNLNTSKNTFDGIDIAKLIASIFIFAMHCGALSDYNHAGFIWELLSRWGVPFFFVASSFFLFGKGGNGNIDKTALQKYIKRIAILYLFWLIINIPNVYFVSKYRNGVLDPVSWYNFLKGAVLSSTFTGSWYLVSSIFSAVVIFLLCKKLKTKTVLIVTAIPFLFCVFSSVYRGVLPKDVTDVLSFLLFSTNIFCGLFYFALGKFICENKEKLTKIFNKTVSAICFFIFYAVFILEIYFAVKSGYLGSTDVGFSTPIIAFFLFLFCLQTKIKIKHGPILRKISTVIYCSQGNLLLLDGLFGEMGVPSLVAFLIVFLFAMILFAILYLFQKKTEWKWVRYLM